VKAIWFETANFLRKNPAWFVVAAWLMLIPTQFIRFVMEVGAIDVRGQQHEWADYDQAVFYLLYLSWWVAAVIAFASSLILGAGLRALASVSVLVAWVGFLAGGAIRLALVEKGPQQFLKYAGEQKFLVPWRYSPRGSDSPSRGRFSVSLCLNSLLGIYDEACHHGAQVTVLPAETGLDSWEERIWQWKYQLKRVTLVGEQSGYQVSTEANVLYYRRSDADGNLQALVTCEYGSCRRQVLIGKLVIDYAVPEPVFVERHGFAEGSPAPDADFSKWDEPDERLAVLANSWAVR
jgi:hypothetical protein